ncbi:uncharacterized protein LOC130709893 [Lotus japonicus]|uniref:uncharacterized protein LOC130709893 n=1 Tax=Lotus japonicus TaxID=34305 RepID=UPI00258BD071|nr:uncharacterized protein LOC130709893 [Lotus japonicus]
MKTISWNCRWLGNLNAVRTLQRLTTTEDPEIVFLMETRRKASEIRRTGTNMGYRNILAVDCRGEGKARGGGLAMFWKEDTNLEIISYSLNHILEKLVDVENNTTFITGFYGFPEEQNKKRSWDLLIQLKAEVNGHWICFGDLNAITSNSKKKRRGGVDKTVEQLDSFIQCLNQCGLVDLGYLGQSYTWCNGRQDEANIQERLDKGVATQSLIDEWPTTTVRHMHRHESDHSPLLIHVSRQQHEDNRKKKRVFRFKEHLTRDHNMAYHLKDAWTQGGEGFECKLERVKETITAIGTEYGSIKKRIADT